MDQSKSAVQWTRVCTNMDSASCLLSITIDFFVWKNISQTLVLIVSKLYNVSHLKCTQTPLTLPSCNTAFNYTPATPFAVNLNLVLHSLAAKAPLNGGFYSIVSGESPDQVFGLLQCRGDVSSQDCQICSNASSSELQHTCQYQKEAVVYYDNCWLRYAHYHFFSTATPDPALFMSNINDVVDPMLFMQTLGGLLNNLSSVAASSSLKFSSGITNFTASLNVYGLVQCTRDLSETSCFNCLQEMINYIPMSCGGKEGCRVFSKSCNIRYELYLFFQSSSSTLPLSPANPPPTKLQTHDGTVLDRQGGKNSSKYIILAATTAVIATILTSTACIWFMWRKARKTKFGKTEDGVTKTVESLIFDLTTLKAATNDFSDSYKLGQGGFGSVYKGKLCDGCEVAVKRLSQTSGQGIEQLKTEVVLVAKLLHKNLVRLLGFCLEKEEKLLVYEYLPNGSLDQILFDQNKRLLLDWSVRYKIILGIAQGLLYLHHDSQIRIIHRDLKASNILLDEAMNPKISDFGLARLFCGSQTQVNTNRIAGTLGYMAPEYAKNGHFSTKSDVFSFGVLILEIVTGRKNSSFRESGNLLTYAWQHWTQGTTPEMMDENLGNQWLRSEAMKCIHIGLLCVQRDAADRPTMSEVILMLNSYSFTCPSPSRPAFYVKQQTADSAVVSSMKVSQQSVNEVTISELEPR